jgi:hypothetical protein
MKSRVNLMSLEERCNPSIIGHIQVDDGSGQRSAVRGVVAIFNQRIQFADPDTAFTLKRTGGPNVPGIPPNGKIQLYVTQVEPSAYEINWYVPSLVFQSRSLVDGTYQFTMNAEEISGYYDPLAQLDGNSDGITGDDAVFNFHRLYGDADGDRDVDASDYLAFRLRFCQPGISSIFTTFLGDSDIFDVNENGSIDSGDFLQFRMRYGTII